MKVKDRFISQVHRLFGQKFVIRFLEKLTGTKIIKVMPLGLDPFTDIKYRHPNYNMEIIIDVGSNIGQSQNHFAKNLPGAQIHCIEPVRETYDLLKINVIGSNTKCHNIAFGERPDEIEIKINTDSPYSVTNTLSQEIDSTVDNFRLEKIQVDTLNNWTRTNNINHINYLKIDTEGYDLNVLKGADELLKEKSIDFIQVEVGMNPFNTFHVGYNDIVDYLEEREYYIYGIYNQIHDFNIDMSILRRCDIVFISKAML